MVIIGKRTGQLGNRLFVFAHIIANAIEYNYEVHNPSFYGYTQYFTGTMNDFFCRYPSRSSRLHGTALQGFYYRLISKGVLPLAKFSAISKLANVKTLDIDPETYPEDCYDMTNPDYIELATSGTLFINDPWLFRDYVNFNKHADRIRTYFTPVEKHSSAVSSLISHARTGCELLVGVHIRQGDYKRWQNGKYYFTTSEYAAIMERFAASMPDKRITFLICSNEKQDEAAFKNLNHVMGSNDALEDMYAFAQCDLLIGPPSTYTAWASFYGSVSLFSLNTATDHIAIDGFHISNG
ncbi:MAG: hypothetical protein WC007_11695 [Pelobacteraceae bacterium]